MHMQQILLWPKPALLYFNMWKSMHWRFLSFPGYNVEHAFDLFHAAFWKWRRRVIYSQSRLTFNRPHSVVSLKTELFVDAHKRSAGHLVELLGHDTCTVQGTADHHIFIIGEGFKRYLVVVLSCSRYTTRALRKRDSISVWWLLSDWRRTAVA